jgi:hypothetical protein
MPTNQNFQTESVKLKNEWKIAYASASEQGSLNPLIIFYNNNEKALSKNYNINLNQLLGLSEEQINKLNETQPTLPPTPTKTSFFPEIPDLKNIFLPSIGGLLTIIGIAVIIKSLKK